MIGLIELPPDDTYRMPPPGKPTLTPEELVVVKWWINQGADATKTVKELLATPESSSALAKLAPATASPATPVPAAKPVPAATTPGSAVDETLATAVAALDKEFPGAVSFESQQAPALVLSAASLRGTLDDAAFAKFAPVLPQLVSADLTATKLTDQGVASLKAATRLRVVRLGETAVTDAALDTLAQLPALESVNLYSTQVTDAGLAKLAALPKLTRLYLWQTAVSPAAVSALKEKLPACEVITGT
jgi:hypothetical protein